MAWKWLRNPTLTNGLVTTYVSHKGNDSTGDGTATNPYKTFAKATSVATAGSNIMLDDGIWAQQRTLNSREFNWWGNGNTWIKRNVISLSFYDNDRFNYMEISGGYAPGTQFFNYVYAHDINGGALFEESFHK
jgi:hypothetical protein